MPSKKTLIFIGLGVALVAIVGLFWLYREAIFSKEVLEFEVIAPKEAKAGEEITYRIRYKNNGKFVLESPRVVFQFPDNSLTEDGKARLQENVDDVYPGQEGFKEFKLRLLGKEGDIKTARAAFSYVPKNLSIRYESTTTATTRIETVPITLALDLPTKVESGKQISYDINYFSNIDYPLEHLSIKVSAPEGFNFQSATPSSLDNTEWKLPTLLNAKGGRITIKGLIGATSGNTLHFKAQLGMWQSGNFVVIKEVEQDVETINALLSISQQVNGSSDYAASAGETLRYRIVLKNTGSTPLEGASVSSKLNSSAFNLSTIQAQEAAVQGSTITWDAGKVSRLQRLAPGQEVSLSFDVTLKESWTSSDDQKNNMLLKNTVTAAGIVQEFSNKINSNIALVQQAYFKNSQAGWENSGPVPPKVDQVTTYTISWQVKNYFNDLKNVKVRMKLPQNAMPVDNISPESQASKFSFDNASREIVWLVGDVSAGTGVGSFSPTLYFQVAFTPTFLQQGTVPVLVGQATITGEDQSTGKTVTGFALGVSTALPDDVSNSGGGLVGQ